MGVVEKRQTKEGDGGYNCGSRRPSIKNYEYQEDNRQARCVCKVLRMCGEGDETSVSHILYRNAGNLLKSNIDVGGKTRWRRSLEPMWKAGF